MKGGGALDKKLCVWNLNVVKQLKAQRTHIDLRCICINRPVKCLRADSQICNVIWNPFDEKEVLSTHGFDSNDINLWDLQRGQKTSTLKGHDKRVLYLALGPSKQDIVTASSDETLRFWNVFRPKEAESDSERRGLDFAMIR